MDLGLRNSRALVTGASKGLGFAIAKILIQEGASVVINSRDEHNLQLAKDQLRKEGLEPAGMVAGDLGKKGTPEQVIEKTAAILGGLDLLLSNTGGPRTGKFATLTEEDWAHAIDLCLLSHVRLIRASLPHLDKSGFPSILTITSISAKQPIPDLILSNTTRAGVLGLTKSLALELAGQRIRVNSILPGWTATDRAIELIHSRAAANQTTPEMEMEKQKATAPLGRMAEPDEFARSAVFLLSPAASYLTGVMLSVDGGTYKGIL
jgi:3-oxoacyl-[acyl-carrier protein] reductase